MYAVRIFSYLDNSENACRTGSGASTIYLQVYLNSDTGANYNGHAFFANGTNVYNENYTPTNSINAKYGSVSNAVGAWGVGVMDFLDYANTTKNKTTRSLNGSWYGSADRGVVLSSGLWRNTSGISSITIFANGIYVGVGIINLSNHKVKNVNQPLLANFHYRH